MGIIDTHTHIYEPDFDNDINDVITRAKNCGVDKILLPNIDLNSVDRLHNLVEKHPDYCAPMMGLHPGSVTLDWKEDLKQIKENFSKHKYIAVGEIGIDLYWDRSLEQEQKLAFEEQLRWSIEYNLPISIHSRDAIRETIECINNVDKENLRGVFHSFGGTLEEMTEILNLKNFYLGINGVVTYKNSKLPEVLTHTNLSHIVIETDAPYLPPVPYRGKRNEPSYTVEIVKKLSEIFDCTQQEVIEKTSHNAQILYGL
ncbi:TatD family hydrolase [Dysgonomonas sp. 520]|uniref:TatD family hydrolase n=1 Tax=Dysgonomonas sp. 520 TaxID=2302931 RepID=UPI0013D452D6|nr:TatD family hydrolase [Dysgonomonas sp. 520]NDW10349.1 TatD family deoxyribonuclease [Dysgonomonas sp. 520]